MAVAERWPAALPAETAPDDMSPPREVRSTDVSRLRAQAGTIVAIVVAAITIVLYMERRYSELQTAVTGMAQRLDSYEKNIDLRLQIMKLEFEKGELRKALLAELKETP